MLSSLHIENIALLSDITVDFEGGFCAFTGETGAGKSMIIDSIGLLCGARSDYSVIRTGEDKALVEGVFSHIGQEVEKALTELSIEPEEDGSLIIRRQLFADGRSVAKVNGITLPLSKLRAIASLLISIHGQQDTQAFAEPSTQLALIDSYDDNTSEREEYLLAYNNQTTAKAEYEKQESLLAEAEQKRDYDAFRLDELNKAHLKAGEEEKLQNERNRLANSEKIITSCTKARELLYLRQGAAVEKTKAALDSLSALVGIIPEAESLVSRLDDACTELTDISETLQPYTESEGENTFSRLTAIEDRLDFINGLKRKNRTDYDGLLELRDRLAAEIESINGGEERLKELKSKLEQASLLLDEKARILTKTRALAAENLAKKTASELEYLDMPSVKFQIKVSQKQPCEDGADAPEFLISANAGEIPKPITNIASGGELSRIMLCLQCVFAGSRNIKTLVFDEIDTGISGKTSEKIGIKLRQTAEGGKQVFCVTHSAVLAAVADSHYLISKSSSNGRTNTAVSKLDTDGRISELSRIIGGLNVSQSVKNTAKELLERYNK